MDLQNCCLKYIFKITLSKYSFFFLQNFILKEDIFRIIFLKKSHSIHLFFIKIIRVIRRRKKRSSYH